MDRFRVKAYTVEYYEGEVEADSEEEAKEKFIEKWENAEIANDETQFFFDDEEGFEVLGSLCEETEEEDLEEI